MKDVFTTGEAAVICGLSPQTIIQCFDSGTMEGFLVPGSRFRRIPKDSLIKFMRENNIPLERLDRPRKKILVADREQGIVDMLKDVLERDFRFEARTALTGQEAIRLAEEWKPDLAVLDCTFPDMSAATVCNALRTNPTLRDIPIIVEGGQLYRKDLVQKFADLKVKAFVDTPFRLDEMVAKIAELLHV